MEGFKSKIQRSPDAAESSGQKTREQEISDWVMNSTQEEILTTKLTNLINSGVLVKSEKSWTDDQLAQALSTSPEKVGISKEEQIEILKKRISMVRKAEEEHGKFSVEELVQFYKLPERKFKKIDPETRNEVREKLLIKRSILLKNEKDNGKNFSAQQLGSSFLDSRLEKFGFSREIQKKFYTEMFENYARANLEKGAPEHSLLTIDLDALFALTSNIDALTKKLSEEN